ncbi:hypothetical protein H0H93_001777 [Arthromyces matolae]|nr:hypothetical protein H0H93_001777 [Arthromyces matolae]
MKAILLSSITLILSATITAGVVIPRDSLVSRQTSPSIANRRRVSGSIALRDISEGIVQLQPRAKDIKDENDKADRSPSPGAVLAGIPLFGSKAVDDGAGHNLADAYRSPSPGTVLKGIPALRHSEVNDGAGNNLADAYRSPSPGTVLKGIPALRHSEVNDGAGHNLADAYRSPSPGTVLKGIPAFQHSEVNDGAGRNLEDANRGPTPGSVLKDIHAFRRPNDSYMDPTSKTTVTRALASAIRQKGMEMPPGLKDSNSDKHQT